MLGSSPASLSASEGASSEAREDFEQHKGLASVAQVTAADEGWAVEKTASEVTIRRASLENICSIWAGWERGVQFVGVQSVR